MIHRFTSITREPPVRGWVESRAHMAFPHDTQEVIYHTNQSNRTNHQENKSTHVLHQNHLHFWYHVIFTQSSFLVCSHNLHFWYVHTIFISGMFTQSSFLVCPHNLHFWYVHTIFVSGLLTKSSFLVCSHKVSLSVSALTLTCKTCICDQASAVSLPPHQGLTQNTEIWFSAVPEYKSQILLTNFHLLT